MNKVLSYLFTFLVVAFSVIPIFQKNEYLLAGTTVLLVFILIFKRKRYIEHNYVWMLLIFFGFLVIQGVVVRSFNFRALSGSATRFLFPFLVLTIYRDKYMKAFIDIVYALSIIGLIIFMLKNIYYPINGLLLGLSRAIPFNDEGLKHIVVYGLRQKLHFGFIYSNSGFANEPGAYAVVLTIALVFTQILNGSLINKKGYVLILSLLSTFSTAAYVSLIILLIAFSYEKLIGQKALRGISFIILILIALPFVVRADFMGSKISSQIELTEDKYETRGRFASATADIQLWITSPIFGIGKGEDNFDYSVYEMGFGSTHRVNGLANFLAKYGVIVFAAYMIFMYASLKKLFKYYNLSGFVVFYFAALLSVAFAQACLQWSAYISLIYLKLAVRK